ncbi:MAG: glycosyltransferase family 2 protein [Planctomycetaceae bacterium]|nr:glycosyltransferase family 2 protein [Planctomycetaceae bacterium]
MTFDVPQRELEADGAFAVYCNDRDRHSSKISAVLPVYNEAAILRELTSQLVKALEKNSADFEIVYVNDGSSDGSRELLDRLAIEDHRIVVVHLARNFGHQPAVHAGLDYASGDVAIVMDSDLQDDPRAIPDFLTEWESGFDVVYAERFNRKESLPKRLLFYSFYRVLNAVSSTPIPQDAGNFGLLDRRVIDILQQLPEQDRYFPGLRSWAGFRQTGVPVERAARHDQHPRVSLKGLFRLAKTAILSFSAFPLTFFYVIAALSASICAASIGFVLFHKLFTGLAIPGWTSVVTLASLFGALNALGISILGEYVIRIYDQVRSRPVYIADSVRNRSRQGILTVSQETGRHTPESVASESRTALKAYAAFDEGSVNESNNQLQAEYQKLDHIEMLLEQLHRDYQQAQSNSKPLESIKRD